MRAPLMQDGSPLLPEQIFGIGIAETFNRPQLLTLQFAKLLNYHADNLVAEWGGDYYRPPGSPDGRKGLENFLRDTNAFDQESKRHWITRRFPTQPWGPENLRMQEISDDALGASYEAYLAFNGAIITMNQASRLLCVDPGLLVQLKLQLLYDNTIVLECIKRQLRPRGLWPKIVITRGAAARTRRIKS